MQADEVSSHILWQSAWLTPASVPSSIQSRMRADRHVTRRTACASPILMARNRSDPPEVTVPVTRLVEQSAEHQSRCPFCQSAHVTINPKDPVSSYRRCETCGQLWHPDRLRTTVDSNRERR
jgi:hypothetical protein